MVLGYLSATGNKAIINRSCFRCYLKEEGVTEDLSGETARAVGVRVRLQTWWQREARAAHSLCGGFGK